MNDWIKIACSLCLCILCSLRSSLGAEDTAKNKLDFLTVQSLVLRRINNDLNGNVNSYTFAADGTRALEIRRVSGSSVDVLVADTYNAEKPERIHAPYVSALVHFKTNESSVLERLLKQSVARLEKGDKRIVHLECLIERLSGKPCSHKPDKLPGFGEVYDEQGRVIQVNR